MATGGDPDLTRVDVTKAEDTNASDSTRSALVNGAPPALLTRDAILAAPDVRYEYHHVPEWGAPEWIKVRSLTATDRDRYDAETAMLRVQAAGPGAIPGAAPSNDAMLAAMENFRARRVAKAIVDEDDNLLFTSADIAALGTKNAAVIDRIDDVVVRLSGMDDEAVKRAIDSLKGAPSGGSGTD